MKCLFVRVQTSITRIEVENYHVTIIYQTLHVLAFFHFPYKVTANLNSLPVEIHAQILSYLDPIDCLSYGKVCRVTARAAECNQVWKRQWLKLSKETPFIFINDLDQLSGTSASLRSF